MHQMDVVTEYLHGEIDIGSLMYASQSTRPNIAHAVGMINRFFNDPGKVY